MRTAALIVALAVLGLLPASAHAKTSVLTLYSPAIQTKPYVHDTHHLLLKANGKQAPATPGYITGFKEQVLVDSKDPDAKPLSNAQMMIHHFLFFAPGRVGEPQGSCWSGGGFITGRGEEHPSGRFDHISRPEARARYGIPNRKPDGSAPDWRLTAMVMNHVKKPKKVWVRVKVYYTDSPRQTVYPTVVGNCSLLRGRGMAYDVPGGGGPGSNFTEQSTWTAPYNGRILLATSHQHGGGKHQTLTSETCDRRLYKAPVYHGKSDHIYNTIRPILHEPGPIANGTFGSLTGVPIRKGEVLRRKAVHDNSNLHVAAMGFWVLHMVKDESVGECDPLPTDVTNLTRPKEFDSTPNYGLRVPQLSPPTGSTVAYLGGEIGVGDNFYNPDRIISKVGQPITWRFNGSQPHTVTVANGPRGFSSLYTGQERGTFTFTPSTPGKYRLTCMVHPTSMGTTVTVQQPGS